MRPLPLLLLMLPIAVACTIESRPPTGARVDDTEIRNTVTRYYTGVAARARDETAAGLWDSVLVARAERGNWYAVRGASAWADSLTVRAAFLGESPESEPARLDIRQQGDIAGVWVTLRGPTGTRVEHLVLTRDRDAWRIVAIISAPTRQPG